MVRFRLALAGAAVCIVVSAATQAADWPQWRGPKRDGVSTEKGLLKAWPAQGPKLLWQATGLGTGYSSVAIVGDRLYTMGDVADAQGSKRQCVLAIDLKTRKRLWAAQVGAPHSDGARCTPTVVGGLVYAVGTDLSCE